MEDLIPLSSLHPIARVAIERLVAEQGQGVPTHIRRSGPTIVLIGMVEDHDPFEGGGLKEDQELVVPSSVLEQIVSHLPSEFLARDTVA